MFVPALDDFLYTILAVITSMSPIPYLFNCFLEYQKM